MRQDRGIICNCCGRRLRTQGDHVVEDFFHLEKSWGYFSDKDGTVECADICESCLEQWTRKFQIRPEITERTELFEC